MRKVKGRSVWRVLLSVLGLGVFGVVLYLGGAEAWQQIARANPLWLAASFICTAMLIWLFPCGRNMPETRVRRRWWTRCVWGAPLLALLYGLAWALYWPALSPATGIHQPLHYNQTYVWPMPWTLHQAAPGVPPPAPLALQEGDAVTQRFQVHADNLAMVRVWLAGERGGEEVLITLSDGAGGQPLYAGSIQLGNGGRGEYYYVTFPVVRQAAGKAYQLGLRAVQGGAIVRVGYVDRIAGQLRLNEFPSPGDLDMGAYHRGRPGLWTLQVIGERLLPRLVRDRIQQYKPGAAKGATFGLLCALLGAGAGLLLWMAVPPGPGRYGRVAAALLALLAAGALAVRWDLGGMVALGPRATLSSVPGGTLPADAAAHVGPAVRDLLAGLAFADREPEPRQIQAQLCEVDGLLQACAAVPAVSEIAYGLHVLPDAYLRLGMALPPGAAQALLFQVRVAGDKLLERTLVPGAGSAGEEVTLDLRPYAGRTVQVELVTHRPQQVAEPRGMPAGGALPVAGLWVAPRITSERTWLLAYPLAQPPEHAQVARFGDQVELLGYDLGVDDARPGGAVRLALYWRALRPIEADYTVFVHLIDAAGEIRGQGDGQPLQGAYPAPSWPPGMVVRDERALAVAEGVQPGPYRVAVGLYELETMVRLPTSDADERVVLDSALIVEGQ